MSEAHDAVAALSAGDGPLIEGSRWLIHEAALLDHHCYDEWFALLSPTLRYTMPVRTTRLDGNDVHDGNGHFEESYGSMEVRIRRLTSTTGWSEIPRSRTRRFVSNIDVVSSGPDHLELTSYLLLLRSRLDASAFDLISAERHDKLVREGGDLRLAGRRIIVDQTSLGTPNLAVLL